MPTVAIYIKVENFRRLNKICNVLDKSHGFVINKLIEHYLNDVVHRIREAEG